MNLQSFKVRTSILCLNCESAEVRGDTNFSINSMVAVFRHLEFTYMQVIPNWSATLIKNEGLLVQLKLLILDRHRITHFAMSQIVEVYTVCDILCRSSKPGKNVAKTCINHGLKQLWRRRSMDAAGGYPASWRRCSLRQQWRIDYSCRLSSKRTNVRRAW